MVTTPVINVSKYLEDVLESNGLTTAFRLPNGTTAQRPSAPKVGQLRWNTSLSSYEFWGGASWDTLYLTNATLTALGSFNTNGMMIQTAHNAFTARSIAGTTNQIAVTNGDGVAGAPTLAIASNAVMPGTGGLVLPSGNTAARGGTDGMIRYNSQIPQLEARINGTWVAVNVT